MLTQVESRRFSSAIILLVATLGGLGGVARADAGDAAVFEVRFDRKLRDEPFTGRVLIFLSAERSGEPRLTHNWLSREPILSQDVSDWAPGQPLQLKRLQGYPYELGKIPSGKYAVQAVMHTNIDRPHSGRAAGNLYSRAKTIDFDANTSGVIRLRIGRKVKEDRHDVDTENAKSVRIRSECLSKFHGRDVFLRCMVALPTAYRENPTKKFPALYVIPGFGGDEREAMMYSSFLGSSKTPFVRIGLDAMCPLGHHVFADSDNNGPYGRALVEELIPHLEKEFRLISEPTARLLTGHSSGGWSSLWLQITYPEYFGGTWSTSPDSVDFRDFCGLDLYDAKTNFFTQSSGTPWPIMRQGGSIKLLLRDFARMEDVLGPGGQMQSFEAVFGPRGEDGAPVPLWDRRTGKIDPEVVKAWRRYDITDKLRREWKTLGPKLTGKITVIIGDADNFYLNGATELLKKALAELGSDARVIIEPERDHGSIMFSPSFRAMMDEMSAKFAASHPEFEIESKISTTQGTSNDD